MFEKLGDVLEKIPDYINVSVVDKYNVEIARYNGKDSIPNKMNQYETIYKRALDGFHTEIKVSVFSEQVNNWKFFVIVSYGFTYVYMVPADKIIYAQIAVDKALEQYKTSDKTRTFLFEMELKKEKIPFKYVGVIEVDKNSCFSEEIPIAII